MAAPGYEFTRDDLAELILRQYYPERTQRESGVLRDYLLAHGREFDRFEFSRRIGHGVDVDPSVPANIARGLVHSTRKRIDLLAWSGQQATIVEVKYRVTPSALGQIQTYRHLFLEEFRDALEPALVVVGRYSDDDTLRPLAAAGVTVYLYESEDTGGNAPPGGV